MSAYWKIPLQALVLLVGVLMFLFYLFTPAPMLFNPVHERELREGPRAAEYRALEQRFEAATASRSAAARAMTRRRGRRRRGAARRRRGPSSRRAGSRGRGRCAARRSRWCARRPATPPTTTSTTSFRRSSRTHMPIGLAGLLIAAISRGGDVDDRRRAVGALDRDGDRLLPPVRPRRGRATRTSCASRAWRPAFWGLFASVVAVWAAELGSLIEVVNRFGSFFYGSILGVFILAVGFPRATANGAFVGLSPAWARWPGPPASTNVAFLWHNVIGAVAVVIVGLAVSARHEAVGSMMLHLRHRRHVRQDLRRDSRTAVVRRHAPARDAAARPLARGGVDPHADDDRQPRHDRRRSRADRPHCAECDESRIVVTHGTDTMVETARCARGRRRRTRPSS